MLQVVSKYRYDGSYRPQLTWGFLKYVLTPDVWLRTGRLGFDIYLNAESRDVGYSYLWVRQPVDNYGQIYYSYFDGFDFNVSHPIGDGVFLAKFYAGKLDETAPARNGLNYEVDGSIWGAQLKYQTLNWLFTTGFGVVSMENDYASSSLLVKALRMTGVQQAGRVADDLSISDSNFFYGAAGIAYERGPLQTSIGFNHIESESLSYSSSWAGAWLLGYHVGKWTPFVGYSRVKSEPPELIPACPTISGIGSSTAPSMRRSGSTRSIKTPSPLAPDSISPRTRPRTGLRVLGGRRA